MTEAVLFRLIAKYRPTLLADEMETYLKANEGMRGLLDGGHTRLTAKVHRCAPKTNDPVSYDSFAAKVLAQLGPFPDTIADRAVVIVLKRKHKTDGVRRLRADLIHVQCEETRRKLARFASDNIERIIERDPELSTSLHDRAQDNWRALSAIAEIAGGDWPSRAAAAALALTEHEVDDDSIGVQLLADIRIVFNETQAQYLSSAQLLRHLNSMNDRPWIEFQNGRPLTPRRLAVLLRPYGIHPRKLRTGDVTIRAYERADFVDVWDRYLPD
jgi:hypothetical protein